MARRAGRLPACCRPVGEIERPSDLAFLATESRRLYSGFVTELEKASGLAIDYQECGALDLAYSQPEWESLQARAVRQAATGIRSKAGSIGMTYLSSGPGYARRDSLAHFSILMTLSLTHARKWWRLPPLVRDLAFRSGKTAPCTELRFRIHEATLESGRGRETFEAVVIAAGAWSNAIVVEGRAASAFRGARQRSSDRISTARTDLSYRRAPWT